MGAKQRKAHKPHRPATRGSRQLYEAVSLLHNGTLTIGTGVVQTGGFTSRPIPTPRVVGRKHPRSWTK